MKVDESRSNGCRSPKLGERITRAVDPISRRVVKPKDDKPGSLNNRASDGKFFLGIKKRRKFAVLTKGVGRETIMGTGVWSEQVTKLSHHGPPVWVEVFVLGCQSQYWNRGGVKNDSCRPRIREYGKSE